MTSTNSNPAPQAASPSLTRLPSRESIFAGIDTSQLPAYQGEIRRAAPMMTTEQVDHWLRDHGYVASKLKVTNHPSQLVQDGTMVLGIVEGISIRGISDGEIVADLASLVVETLADVKDQDFKRFSLVEFGFLRRVALRLEGNALHCDCFFTLTTSECPKGALMLKEAENAIRAGMTEALDGAEWSLGSVTVHHGGREWELSDSPQLMLVKQSLGGSGNQALVQITMGGKQ